MPGGGLNLAWECVERHARGARSRHAALRWRARDGARSELTYAEFACEARRFTGVLRELGVQLGQAVFLFLRILTGVHARREAP